MCSVGRPGTAAHRASLPRTYAPRLGALSSVNPGCIGVGLPEIVPDFKHLADLAVNPGG